MYILHLRSDKMQHISLTEFRSINWLPSKERAHQCINAKTFKLVNRTVLFCLNKIFEFASHCRINTRNSFPKHPFRETNTGQKTVSNIGPSLWDDLPQPIKRTNNLNAFKHNVKNFYLNQ